VGTGTGTGTTAGAGCGGAVLWLQAATNSAVADNTKKPNDFRFIMSSSEGVRLAGKQTHTAARKFQQNARNQKQAIIFLLKAVTNARRLDHDQ
jgi:hypothetical protein